MPYYNVSFSDQFFFKGTLLINGSLSSNHLGGKGEKRIV